MSSIKLSKKAGGSSIDHKPLFSSTSGLLFIGCGPILRVFSTETGEHIQDVEIRAISVDKPEGNIVDICAHPFDGTKIVVCFEEGRLVIWSFESNTIVQNEILNIGRQRIVQIKPYVVNEEEEKFDIFVAIKENDSNSNFLKLSTYSFHSRTLKKAIQKRFDFRMHSWSVTGCGGKDFLAGIAGNALTILNLKTRTVNKDIPIGGDKSLGDRYFTCVVCHPLDECVAAGDNTGRIILYYDFLRANNKSPHVVYHWHTLPVNDIIFSPSGSHLYSGGHEHVLVKWTVHNPEVRNFLPRLAAPIVHITASHDMQYVALSTLDNSILIVNSQQKIHCTVQQFTWGFVSVPGQKLFPCGLVIDSRSNCIVMNGRPGHIQFYSPQYSALMYNVDVVEQNYISQERSKNINNAEVVAIQFSADGRWLTTAQQREDPDFRSNTFLKFWLFEPQTQKYKLDSCITVQYQIRKIACQPLIESDKDENDGRYLFATQCSDDRFRLWLNFNGAGQKTRWNCHSIGYYREYSLADIDFSSDGSLLGAAFGPCLTLWDTDTDEMKCSLAKGSEPIRHVVFAHEDCSFISIVCTGTTLYAWNLLSLALMWSLDLNVSFLVANPRSDHVAAFLPDNSLYVFKASSVDPVYERKKLCDADANILSAVFFPVSDAAETQTSCHGSWLCNSSLYFFTSSQELMAFEMNRESRSEALAFVADKSAPTPFKALIAEQSESAVSKDYSRSFLQLGVPWAHDISQFINSQPHAMAPVHKLCESLLQSMVIKR